MRIEPATAEDCPAIAKIHVASWQEAYRQLLPADYLASMSVAEREALWRRVQQQKPTHLWVARTDAHEVAGFIDFGAPRGKDAPHGLGEIRALYVLQRYWSTGMGRALWHTACSQMHAERFTTVSLWVLSGNERAIRFYERNGCVADPSRSKSLQYGDRTVEACWLSKELGASSATG